MSVDTVTIGVIWKKEFWKFRTEDYLRDNIVQPPNEKTVARGIILNDKPLGVYG